MLKALFRNAMTVLLLSAVAQTTLADSLTDQAQALLDQGKAKDAYNPVSYTHLDVYKRQM